MWDYVTRCLTGCTFCWSAAPKGHSLNKQRTADPINKFLKPKKPWQDAQMPSRDIGPKAFCLECWGGLLAPVKSEIHWRAFGAISHDLLPNVNAEIVHRPRRSKTCLKNDSTMKSLRCQLWKSNSCALFHAKERLRSNCKFWNTKKKQNKNSHFPKMTSNLWPGSMAFSSSSVKGPATSRSQWNCKAQRCTNEEYDWHSRTAHVWVQCQPWEEQEVEALSALPLHQPGHHITITVFPTSDV